MLRARDIMTGKVVVLSEDDSLQEAANTIIEQRISGAPVVDAAGVFVGMLSLTDIAHPDDIAARAPNFEFERDPQRLDRDDATHWELLRPTSRSTETSLLVKHRMSRGLVAVRESAPLIDIARIMCSGHRHRVVVVDERGGVCGIVSTMDLLAAFVNTVDEP